MKNPKQLEKHFKGIANHRRIEILFLVNKSKGITLDAIAKTLGCNIKTISEHARRLAHAGLIEKKHKGASVSHSLTPYGKLFISFIRTFSNS